MAQSLGQHRVLRESVDSEKKQSLRSDFFGYCDGKEPICIGDLVTTHKRKDSISLVRSIDRNTKTNQWQLRLIKISMSKQKKQFEVTEEKSVSVNDIKSIYRGNYYLVTRSSSENREGRLLVHHKIGISADIKSDQVWADSEHPLGIPINKEQAACLYRIQNMEQWSKRTGQLQKILEVEKNDRIFFCQNPNDWIYIKEAEMIGVSNGYLRLKGHELFRFTIDDVILPDDLFHIHSWERNWKSKDHKLNDIFAYYDATRKAKSFGKLVFIIEVPPKDEELLILRCFEKSDHGNSEIEKCILEQLEDRKSITSSSDYKVCQARDIQKCKAHIEMTGRNRGRIICRTTDGVMLDFEGDNRGKIYATLERHKAIESDWVPYLLAIHDRLNRVKVVHNQQMKILEQRLSVEVMVQSKEGVVVNDTLKNFDEDYVVLQKHMPVTVDKVFCKEMPSWLNDNYKPDSHCHNVRIKNRGKFGKLKGYLQVPWEDFKRALIEFEEPVLDGALSTDLLPFAGFFKTITSKPFGLFYEKEFQDVADEERGDGWAISNPSIPRTNVADAERGEGWAIGNPGIPRTSDETSNKFEDEQSVSTQCPILSNTGDVHKLEGRHDVEADDQSTFESCHTSVTNHSSLGSCVSPSYRDGRFDELSIVTSKSLPVSTPKPPMGRDEKDLNLTMNVTEMEQEKEVFDKTSLIQKLDSKLCKRVELSYQLSKTKLQRGEAVLVPKYDGTCRSQRSLSPDRIENVTGQKIMMVSGREFTIDQIFDSDYLVRPHKELGWTTNHLGNDEDSFSSGELICYRKKGDKGGGIGIVNWYGEISWERASYRLGIECVTSDEVGENDSQFINYRKIVDDRSTIIAEDQYISNGKVKVLVKNVKDQNGKVHERGSLWVEDDKDHYRVDDDGEYQGDEFEPVPNEMVKFIVNAEAQMRLRFLLSQQLKMSSLKRDGKIRIADDNYLIRCRILEMRDGLVHATECDDDREISKYPDEEKDECCPLDSEYDKAECVGDSIQDFPDYQDDKRRYPMMRERFRSRRTFEVPLHKVYDDDYNTRKTMDWTKDLLGENECAYERDQMIYFKTENPTRYTGGVLKHVLKTPWNDQVMLVIERCTNDNEFEKLLKPDLVNFSYLYFDSLHRKRVIISEDQILKGSSLAVGLSESYNPKMEIIGGRGTLWIHNDKKLFAFDGEMVIPDKIEFDKIPGYHDHLMFAVNKDQRLRVLGLKQLGESKLSSGETVLVALEESENPKDLQEGIVKKVQYGKISIKTKDSKFEECTADRVYHNAFLNNLHLDGEETNIDVVFLNPKKQKYRLGNLKWITSLAWERNSMFIIELFPKFRDDLKIGESVPIYIHFKHIANVMNKWRTVTEDEVYHLGNGVQIYLLTGRPDSKEEREIHCELHALLGNDETKKVKKDGIKIFLGKSCHLEKRHHCRINYTKITSVPHEVLRYLVRIPQNILRLRFLKSKQFDKKNLKVGQPVLIDCGTHSLEETKIEALENGLIVVEGDQVVTIDKIFDAAYRERKPEWTKNLLETQTQETDKQDDIQTETLKAYEKDDLVMFSHGKGICVGFLKWKGSIPWLESHLVGIECIKKNNDDFQSAICNGRLVHFVPILDLDEENSIIVEENEIQKAEIFILNIKSKGFGVGTLWSKKDSTFHNIEEEGEINCEEFEKDDISAVPQHLLPFVLRIIDLNERKKVMLSGQLQGLQLQQGEKVFVVKDPEKVTGNPIDLLDKTKIVKVTNKDIEVEKFGEVDIGRIFVSSYFSDAHPWTDNCLGKPGCLQVSHDKYVQWGKDGEEMSGKVKWLGKVPWQEKMLVGISTTTQLDRGDDFDGRYLHFLQLMHSDKRQSIIIPENMINDDYLSDPIQSPLVPKPLDDFPLECYVSLVDGEQWYIGTVRWTGEYISTLNTPLAVVVLNKKHEKGTAGRFMGISLVHCPPSRALLISSKLLYRVPDLEIGDCVQFLPPANGPNGYAVVKWVESNPKKKWAQQIGIQLRKRYKRSVNVRKWFNCPDGYGMIVPAYKLAKTKEQEAVFENPVPPISCKNLKEIVGENKGIQGFCNSCYLDTILFSMFTFTSAFEDRIPKGDPDVEEGRNLVLNGIVYPLRKDKFVPFEKTSSLRQLLVDLSGDDAYLSKTRDIPECLEILFGKALEIKPWIRTFANNMHMSSYHTEILPYTEARGVATSQLYLEFSAMFMDFRFSEIPSTLILQLQRQGNHNPKPMVPSLFLDLTVCMANYVPDSCSSCKDIRKQPKFRVDSRFDIDMNGLKSTYVCSDCAAPYPNRVPLSASNSSSSATSANNLMKLTAVICIESSHYNCFVRCDSDEQSEDDDWIFFDSMADQTPTGENIPRIISVDLAKWIREALSKREISPRSYYFDKNISERPFIHPYALIYQSCN